MGATFVRVRHAWRATWLVVACVLWLSACDFDLSASEPRSRHQGVLERAFPDPRAQALAIAAEQGDAGEVRRLMRDEGVDPDEIFGGSDGGMPLLAWPIYSRSPEGLRAMLEAGADPNVKKRSPSDRGERYHANAMVWAAEQEDPAYLQLLLDHGGDPDTRNANNEALLFHAFIKQNQWRNVQLLVERGADVNASVGMGGTLIGHYASNGGFMMVHWLLEHGADPTLDYAYDKPVHGPDSHTIEAVFWHPGNPDDPTWQRKCQEWLIGNGHERPAMPEHYRLMRERLGFPHEESRIPLL
ncbi:ankyrin repeat domain-containing protein [Luteimonas viscosa]|uniref:Ankyrin repeat domain-containing protein n=2 Tax=Luteimonas viscosa TaxID=1132694 RepID=A0A5D4XTY4_9GAMM|nr:ankyrin repeat domain-containing protein [Luteimonas viscosa]